MLVSHFCDGRFTFALLLSGYESFEVGKERFVGSLYVV